MANSVVTNTSSLFAQRMLNRNQGVSNQAMERLSSGLRINSARDDAAGLSISSAMTSQINGYNQAVRNANDGVSALQVADGALDSVTNSLQRIRELSVQAANETYSLENRQAIQSEIDALGKEINSIAETTEFNGTKLFQRGDLTPESDVDKQAVIDGLFSSWFGNSEQRIFEQFGIQGDGATLKIDLSDTPDPDVLASVSGTTNVTTGKTDNQILTIDMSDFEKGIAGDGGNAPFYSDRIIAHEMVHAVMGRSMDMGSMPTWFLEGSAELIHGADERVYNDLVANDPNTTHFDSSDFDALAAELGTANTSWEGSSAQYSVSYAAVRFLHEDIKANGGEGIKDLMVELSTSGASLDATLTTMQGQGKVSWGDADAIVTAFTGTGSNFMQTNFNFGNADTGAIGGLDVDGEASLDGRAVIEDDINLTLEPMTGFDVELPTKGKINDPLLTAQYNLQVGANNGETIQVSLSRIDSDALGINDIDVTTDASGVIDKMDKALSYVNDQRSEIGASINRLHAAVSVNELNSQSTSASRSRIQDADFALETSKLSKSQILQQAGTSMLTQANASVQSVLSLLG
ncbi:flagellinolysin [Psychromonas ossibalaenae]|uniref:flagellinolysin n=1 Tax=Psychromonas ossibalaenae TaxID=444922 RepID=UPI0004776B9C|nr:flagellinolysin [Psychromonas ossibalaenae]